MSTLVLDDARPAALRRLRILGSEHAGRATSAAQLIERDVELKVLDEAVRALATGRGGVVVIDAPAGLGKTALLEYAAAKATAGGCAVRWAAPAPLERTFSFGVVRALLEAPLREASEHERARVLRGPAAAAGELLLGGERSDGAARASLAHGVLWLCAALAERRPLVLVLDDAQWADRDSLEVASYLARRIEDVPVLILVGARTDHPGAAADVISVLGGARSAIVLHPQPLTPAGAVRLIHRVAPDAPVAACCESHRSADGIPWLLAQLAGRLANQGPAVDRAVRVAVRRRTAELPARERGIAAAMSVVGDDVAPAVVAATAQVSVDELRVAFHAFAAAGLLGGDQRRFAHELVATAIREDLLPIERERLHRAAARALSDAGAPDEIAAEHLMHTGAHADPDAARLLLRAGRAATQRGAPRAAVAYLEHALGEDAPGIDRAPILLALANASFDAGLPGARRYLHEALGDCSEPMRAEILTRLATLSVAAGDEPMPHTAAPADGGELLVRAGHAHRAWLATERGTPSAGSSARTALAALDGDLLLAEAGRSAAYHLCVRALLLTDRVDAAREAIVALHDCASDAGSVPLRAAAAWYAAELALRTGRVAEAEGYARQVLDAGAEDIDVVERGAVAVLVCALAERGAWADADRLLIERGRHVRGSAGVLHARARLRLAEGDFERAHTDACEAGALQARRAVPNPTRVPWRSTAAVALAHLGRFQEAIALAEAEHEEAERFGAPVPIVRALHARAVAEADDRERIAICRRALAVLGPHVAVLESVRLRLELGSALAHLGQRVHAREALRPALADADAVGASILADRARRELVATGLRPRRAALEGVPSLTPRQRQICELAAAGKANREIAHQLFLSIKTVETHLAAAYRKLRVGTRAELAAQLAQ